jgi:hypothetical protein
MFASEAFVFVFWLLTEGLQLAWLACRVLLVHLLVDTKATLTHRSMNYGCCTLLAGHLIEVVRRLV